MCEDLRDEAGLAAEVSETDELCSLAGGRQPVSRRTERPGLAHAGLSQKRQARNLVDLFQPLCLFVEVAAEAGLRVCEKAFRLEVNIAPGRIPEALPSVVAHVKGGRYQASLAGFRGS